jgi:hypothetical protein
MAYNPFHGFRKNQKAWFAGLTILSMVTFVLMSGTSTVLDLFRPLFGSGDRTAEVATLYGKTVSVDEVRQLQYQRQVANEFMNRASVSASANALKVLGDRIGNSSIDKETQNRLKQILALQQQLFMNPDPRYAQFIPMFLQQQLGELEQIRQGRVIAQKPDEAKLIQDIEEVLYQQVALMQRRNQMYFGGSVDGKGMLDFLIWRHQADRLGIQLGGDDLDRLVSRDTRGYLTGQDSSDVYRYLRQRFGNITRDSLRHALAEEFRVRLAQEALVGTGAHEGEGTRMEQAPVTPFELWQFYRTHRTESEIAMLPIRVDSQEFLQKVGEPTEEELHKLFEAGKDREEDPSSEQAGFKQPSRTMLEWVSARPDSPNFKKAADVAAAVTEATMPVAFNSALLQIYRNEMMLFPTPTWSSEATNWHDHRALGAQTVAAVVGSVGSGAGDPAVSAVTTLLGAEGAREAQIRAGAAASIVLAPTGFVLNALAPALSGKAQNPYRSFAEMRAHVLDRFKDDMARTLARESLNRLRDYLTARHNEKPEDIAQQTSTTRAAAQALALGSVPGAGSLAAMAYAGLQNVDENRERLRHALEVVSAAFSRSPVAVAAALVGEQGATRNAVQSYVAESIQRYGLEHGNTTRPRDRFDIDQDEGLKPLREAYSGSANVSGPGGNARQFASQVFAAQGLYNPQQLPGAEQFLVWKTEEQPPYVPDFAEARPRVAARWKLEKARPLAKAEAERVAAEAKKAKGDPERNLEDAGKRFGVPIRLEHVAKLVARPSAVPSRFGSKAFEPYRVPEYEVQYPTDDFTDKLLALKEPGEVTVLHDKPDATYYVAALTRRSEPYELSFYSDTTGSPDPLMDHLAQQERYASKYRDACLSQLRADGRLQVNEDALKPLDSRATVGLED